MKLISLTVLSWSSRYGMLGNRSRVALAEFTLKNNMVLFLFLHRLTTDMMFFSLSHVHIVSHQL